jgi:hypothetical protein
MSLDGARRIVRIFLPFALWVPALAQLSDSIGDIIRIRSGDELLRDYLAQLSSPQGDGTNPGSNIFGWTNEYQRSLMALGLDPCAVYDQQSGNLEISTASSRSSDPDENLRDASAHGYAAASIIQFECGPNAPKRPAGLLGRGISMGQPRSDPDPTPGYAVMARWKGKFTESIAPRPLTVLPGYGNARAGAIQQMGGSDFNQAFSQEAQKVAKSLPWIPQGLPDMPDPANMSAAERQRAIEGVMQNAQRMQQTAEQNFTRMSPEEQQRAIQQWAQAYQGFMNSGPGQTLTTATPMYGKDTGGQITPLAFLNFLQPRECLIDAYKFRVRKGNAFGDQHYMLVVSESLIARRFVDLGPAGPIDSAIQSFFETVRSGEAIAPRWTVLEQLIARPLVGMLPRDTVRLWLSPDSSLGLVPFAALLLDVGSPVSVSIAPSVYDFARLRSTPPRPASGTALIVGDIDFGPQRGEFLPLGGASREVIALSSIADDARLNTTMLRRTQAVRPAVVSRISDAQFVHFATHGFIHLSDASDAKTLFRSAGIALSGANSHRPDAILTANDIRQLDLTRARLVTLSACETGAGKETEGQGLIGFQTAFMAAGARSVLLSLWRVPDEPTAAFMNAFYEALWIKRVPNESEALRIAQNTVRSNPAFANPVNWGAWVLIGE